jgi:hypothetical protein
MCTGSVENSLFGRTEVLGSYRTFPGQRGRVVFFGDSVYSIGCNRDFVQEGVAAMPDIFDRFGDFLKSIFSDAGSDADGEKRFYDQDMQNAWDELEDYLNDGKGKPNHRARRDKASDNGQQHRRSQTQERLREDYANLKVPFGSPFIEVKKSYKKLLRQYHPDRHAADPQKFKLATEITAKLNQSFDRIEKFETTGK